MNEQITSMVPAQVKPGELTKHYKKVHNTDRHNTNNYTAEEHIISLNLTEGSKC